MQKHTLTHFILCIGLSVISLMTSTACAAPAETLRLPPTANDNLDIRTKVAAAYGKEKLARLKSIYFLDEYRETYRGQGYTPEYDNFWVVRGETYLDLENELGSYESWSDQYGRIMQFHTLSTTDGIANIDYETGYYSINPDSSFYQMFGRNFRASDLLLAYELVKSDSQIEIQPDRIYLGRPHHHIVLNMTSSPPLHLYIDQRTGLIQRMQRQIPDGPEVIYVFENFKEQDGLTHAKEFRLFINGELVFVTRDRSVKANLKQHELAGVFKLADGLDTEPERIQFENMTVQKVSERLHHVGQEDFSSFYDAGDYIIGFGGYGGLKERFEAYRKEMGHNKPLRYQIPTHHHSDHTAGITDAVELGATILIPERIKAKLMKDYPLISEDRYQTYASRHQQDGLQMYVVSTSHAENMAVIYVPEAKTLFQEDHYVRMFKSESGIISRNGFTLWQAIQTLDLDIDTLLSVHVGHIESWDAFSNAASRYAGVECFYQRSLCPRPVRSLK